MDVHSLGTLTDAAIAQRDTAHWNLSLAVGLPGSEGLDLRVMLARLNHWAEKVAAMTKRNLPRYHRDPSEYQHSVAQFRIACLITVLQRDFGVHYDRRYSEGAFDASDSRSHFIHGLLTGVGGSCVNLPELYVAVGRRLGYPLRLVLAKEHIFVRWVGKDGEHFNIEATSFGFRALGDEYYHRFPKPLSPQEIASGKFLQDLTPRQELALYLCGRGFVALDNLRVPESLEAIEAAAKLDGRYDADLAITKFLARIHQQLDARAVTESDLWAEIELATPRPDNSLELSAMQAAQNSLHRILWRMLSAKLVKQGSSPRTTAIAPSTFTFIA